MKVLLFAGARDAAGGRSSLHLLLPREGTPLGEVLEMLSQGHPTLRRVLPSCRFALNGSYLEGERTRPLRDRDELAILPPYSGG